MEENMSKVRALRDRLIEGLKDIPYSQLNGDPVKRLPGNVNWSFEGVEGESLLLHLDMYGIECSSYGTYFYIGETPMEELRRYIAAAKMLGTNILRLWCGKKSGAEMTGDEREAFLAECRLAAKIAEEEDVILCMECHRKSFTEHLEDALVLMNEVNSEHFRMYWQPFQWQSVQENLAYAEAIAPFTHHIHVFQWKGEQKFSLNEGIEEWQGYLQKFAGPRTLLLEFMPDGLISTLSAEAEALRRIIEK